jgi:Protein of unknown function (DUF1552)
MNRRALGRRAFLTGAGGVAIGLPFLEGLPTRSAWAQDKPPVFTLFVVGQNGVVNKNFFPSTNGAFTTASLAGASDIATSVLSPHAQNLLFIKNINYPLRFGKGCGHSEGCVQTLTGLQPGSSGNTAYASGPSADTLIAKALGGPDPLALYSGGKGFIAERISFKAAGAGQVRSADTNPYLLYSKIVGLGGGAPSTPGEPSTDPVAEELATKRKSVNDLVRGQLNRLKNLPELSMADRDRLEQHFQAIRDLEVNMGGMVPSGAVCSTTGLPVSEYEALRTGFAFKSANMEQYIRLHLQALAVAFGCNYSRVATVQWGDGTDGTKYEVPSNAGLGWSFHQISHRMQSDTQSGNNPTAEAAHHEIDTLRMRTLLAGLDAFKAHGLEGNAQIVWTNTLADGPSHSAHGVPMIVWGSGGGYLKQGTLIDAAGTVNNKVLNTLMAAATRDVTMTAPVIGSGTFDAMAV